MTRRRAGIYGRSNGCHLRPGMRPSANGAARSWPPRTRWGYSDLKSLNGTYVNGQKNRRGGGATLVKLWSQSLQKSAQVELAGLVLVPRASVLNDSGPNHLILKGFYANSSNDGYRSLVPRLPRCAKLNYFAGCSDCNSMKAILRTVV